MYTIVTNKKYTFSYTIERSYIAGIQLKGSEVKAIREKKISISEAYCFIKNNEIFLKNSHISEYRPNGYKFSHQTIRDRKLLLTKKEIKEINNSLKQTNLTLIPLKVIVSDTGFIKLEICIAKGRNANDKRQAIKEREIKKEIRTNII